MKKTNKKENIKLIKAELELEKSLSDFAEKINEETLNKLFKARQDRNFYALWLTRLLALNIAVILISTVIYFL